MRVFPNQTNRPARPSSPASAGLFFRPKKFFRELVSIEVSEGGWDAPNREEADASLDSEGSTQACRELVSS